MTRCMIGILVVLPTKKVHHTLNAQKLEEIKLILNFERANLTPKQLYNYTEHVRLY